jgi:uracil-DNA glycosylase
MAPVERAREPISTAEAESLMQWWSDAGVDCLVDDAPRDWLRPAPPPAVAPTVGSPADPLPGQLELFHAYLKDSDRLPYAAAAAPRICPTGDPASGLMLMTDMPTIEDCDAGAIFSGEVGRLFDRMLAAIGRDRNSVYLASLSCLRSPSGAFNAADSRNCAALARHHIGLAAPRALLLLGDTCVKAMLGMSVMQARGRWHQISTHAGDIAAMATFHPSYLLDRPAAKAQAWADLQMLMERFA